MGAARHIGRLGGLAVALGIGTALCAGVGVASAETGDGGSSNPSPKAESSVEAHVTSTKSKPKRLTLSKAIKDAAPKAVAAPKTVAAANQLALKPPSLTARLSTHSFLAAPPTPRLSVADKPAPKLSSVAGVAKLVDGVLNRLAGGLPQSPTDSPAAWVVAAAARRDFAVAAVPGEPDIGFDDGVVTGCVVSSCPSSSGANALEYTVVVKPNLGGKVIVAATDGKFSYLPDISTLNSGGTEQFSVLVSETTPFDTALENLPVVGLIVKPVLRDLHQVPILGVVLSPVIGRASVQQVSVDVGDVVPVGVPVAFTEKIESFDGTMISTNFFPADNLAPGEQAPTLLNGPSLATAGYIDPSQDTTVFGLVPGLAQLREHGYSVITWDPRGEYDSTGVLHLDSPDFEAKDVQAIIDWATTSPETKPELKFQTDDPTDPLLGMVGGSYGGGIQWVSAAADPRIDAIVPGISWNTLNESLYPANSFKTSFATLLLLSLVVSGSRIDPEIYSGIITGAALGFLTQNQQDFLASSGPDFVLKDITAPTLIMQGTADDLFPLDQSLDNQLGLDPAVPVKIVWYCGGHGQCLDPVDQTAQSAFLADETFAWLDTYVKDKGTGAPPPVTGPKFEWVDQDGHYFSSDVLPTDPSFYGDTAPITGSSKGGALPLVPVIGGSGPQTKATFPVSLALGTEAPIALDLSVVNADAGTPKTIVGSPKLTFDYSGIGTSRHVYAQIVDEQTGRVVGNIVTPIDVTLDGKTHPVDVDMEDIAYTMEPGDKLTLQIVGSATPFEDFLSYGVINVSNVQLTLPVADPAMVEPIGG